MRPTGKKREPNAAPSRNKRSDSPSAQSKDSRSEPKKFGGTDKPSFAKKDSRSEPKKFGSKDKPAFPAKDSRAEPKKFGYNDKPSFASKDSRSEPKKFGAKDSRKVGSKGSKDSGKPMREKRAVTSVRPMIIPAVKIKPAMGKELTDMWTEYLAIEDWTPADRWLANRMGSSVFSRLERLWIGGMFLAALRFGQFALYAEQKLTKSEPSGSTKKQLRKIPVDNFFFWIEQRLLTDKQTTTPFRFRHETHSEAHAMVKQLFDGIQKGIERNGAIVFDGIPLWIVPFVERRAAKSDWTDSDKHRFFRRHSSTQPLWIRINSETRRTEVDQELKTEKFTTVKRDGNCYAIRGDKNIVTLSSYKKGYIDIQDYASQQIGNAVISRAEDAVHVWDCCAGNGGKTMQIATGTDKLTIRVSDINDRKLVRINERAVQQGVTDKIAYVPWDGKKLPDFHKSIAANEGFDIVLIDAPCSGSGTWRKNPDGRLFFEETKLNEVLSVQKKLLKVASHAVKPGGWLIYGTCSFLVEENESQIDTFLADYRNFRLDEMKLCGNPDVDSDTTFFAAIKRMR